MLILTNPGTADKLQLVTSAAVTVDVHVSWVDHTTATDNVEAGRTNTAITTATTTDICAGPASGVIRNVKGINARNKHASTSVDVTVVYDVAGTDYELFKVTLNAGQTLEFVEGVGFFVVAQTAKLYKNLRVTSDYVNATTSFSDITGLTWPVESGKHYNFEAHLYHRSDATTSGSQFGINGPAMTILSINAIQQITASVTAAAYGSSAAVVALDTAAVVETTGPGTNTFLAIMSGYFNPSAAGTFAIRGKSEVAVAAGLTVKQGSWMQLWETDNWTMADTKISALAAVTTLLGTDEFVLARSSTTKKVTAANALMYDAYAILEDQKASGTSGGASGAAGSWHTRTLNTEVDDAAGFVSLSSSQFTLAAGKYRVNATAPFQNTSQVRLRIQNITDGTTAVLGTSEFQAANGSNQGSTAGMRGTFTIAGTKAMELQYRVTAAAGNSSDLGAAAGFGVVEVFAVLEIWREVAEVADFLVMEEDGTSHIQIEETTTDDLELEESVEDVVVGRFDPHIQPMAMFEMYYDADLRIEGWFDPEFVTNPVVGPATHYGSVTLPLTVTIGTAGFAKKLGVTATPLTMSIAVAGFARKTSSVTLPLTMSIAVNGTREVLGSVTLPLTVTIGTAGFALKRGVTATPLTMTFTVAGKMTAKASATLPLTFTVATNAVRKTYSSLDLPLTMTTTTGGRVGAQASVTLPLTFNVDSMWSGGAKFGSATLPLTVSIDTAGFAKKQAAAALPLTVTVGTAAKLTARSSSTLPLTVTFDTAGTRTTTSAATWPITVGFEVDGTGGEQTVVYEAGHVGHIARGYIGWNSTYGLGSESGTVLTAYGAGQYTEGGYGGTETPSPSYVRPSGRPGRIAKQLTGSVS